MLRLRDAAGRRVQPVPKPEHSSGRWEALRDPFSPPQTGRPPLDVVTPPPGSEALLGLLLIRVVLPVVVLGLAVWAHIRISMSMRKRLDLPTDIKAKLDAFKHQVSENCESLDRHISKDAARWQQAAKVTEREAEAAATEAPSTMPASGAPVGPTVPMSVWMDASKPQRDAWASAGYGPAEAS